MDTHTTLDTITKEFGTDQVVVAMTHTHVELEDMFLNGLADTDPHAAPLSENGWGSFRDKAGQACWNRLIDAEAIDVIDFENEHGGGDTRCEFTQDCRDAIRRVADDLLLNGWNAARDDFTDLLSEFKAEWPLMGIAWKVADIVTVAKMLNEYRVVLSALDKAMRRYSAGSADYVGDIRTA